MARRKRSSVQKYHDRVAGRYDAIYDDEYWLFHDAITWDHLKAFLPEQSHAPVVDLGCGTGKWSARLFKSGYEVTCVDISAGMIDRARKNILGTDPDAPATFVQADLCDLQQLPADRFHLATAFGEPLCSTASPARALKQIHRILRPGATLVATVDNLYAGLDYFVDRGDIAELQQFIRTGRTRWLTRKRDEQFEITMFTPEGFANLLDKTGFELLDMIGKTVLPLRRHRGLLADPAARRRLQAVEKRLCRSRSAMGRASHLQVAARRRS